MPDFTSSPEVLEAAVEAAIKAEEKLGASAWKTVVIEMLVEAAPVIAVEAFEAGRQAERERLRELFSSEAEKVRAVMDDPDDKVVRGILQGTAVGLEAAVNLSASPVKGGGSE